MHTLRRNRKPFTYELYLGKADALDKNGYKTGEKKPVYDSPVTMYARISAARGSTTEEIFGVTTDYTRTIITDNMQCPIDENTRITIEGDVYCVVKVAKSLNHIMVAVKEVES